jgi:arylsulfatase A-like enzyme/Flp pilus assembly protein TadD
MRRVWPGLLALGLVSCARGPVSGDLAGWNVLLITIDTLRADRLGFMGYDGVETPVLDDLAASGVVFDGAVSSAPVTLPAHATILTGLYPPAHGALDNGFYSLPEGVPTLATILKEEGYDTAAVIGAYVLVDRAGLDAGFDVYDDEFTKPRLRGQAYRERRAAEVTAKAAAWLESRSSKAPFFLWAHYFDPHAPYDPPEPYATRYRLRRYEGEIAYTDELIGRLLEAVHAAGELDRTLVVVTADHGEAFGDGGEMTHGMLLRGSTLRVPLVLAAAGRLAKGRRVAEVVGTADVTPTILDLLGVSGPGDVHGISLLPAIRGERREEHYVYSETRLPTDEFGWSMLAGVRGDRWAWVRAPRPELYDLEADPGESNSLHEARPGLVERLDGLVGEILDRGRESVARAHLSDEQVSALRSLGYLVSHEPPPSTGEDPKDMIYIQAEGNLLMNYLDRGEPERVLEGMESLLEKTPLNRELLMLRAQANARLGNLEPAIADMRECLATGGSLEVDGTLLAMWLNQAGKSGEAEALLESFVEAEPDFAQHSYNLGNLLGELDRTEEAVAAYERALELDPDNIPALVNLGFALSRLEGDARDVDRAREAIDRAIELAHDDVPSLMKIDLCQNLGLLEEGLAVARELQQKPKLRGITRQQLADALRRLQETEAE